MADKSNIEWTDATWNPIVGCSIVSSGCINCYAMRDAWRKHHNPAIPHYRDLTKVVNGNPVWTGKIAEAPDHILTAPLRWRKPKRIFVNSMGDLFHESIFDSEIDKVFAVMALCPQHTFQVLTKRAERMRDYMLNGPSNRAGMVLGMAWSMLGAPSLRKYNHQNIHDRPWPLPNVWLGVSCEDQDNADERIPHLLQTPAAIRFVSAEPLLGLIDLLRVRADDVATSVLHPILRQGGEQVRPALDWIIVGGESGKDARPMHPQWSRDIRNQCVGAGVPFFFKQHGEWVSLEDDDHVDPHGEYETRLVNPDGKHISADDVSGCDFANAARFVYRLGKKRAGRLLDGREHNEFPKVAA